MRERRVRKRWTTCAESATRSPSRLKNPLRLDPTPPLCWRWRRDSCLEQLGVVKQRSLADTEMASEEKYHGPKLNPLDGRRSYPNHHTLVVLRALTFTSLTLGAGPPPKEDVNREN